jgi:hypothetical protein
MPFLVVEEVVQNGPYLTFFLPGLFILKASLALKGALM